MARPQSLGLKLGLSALSTSLQRAFLRWSEIFALLRLIGKSQTIARKRAAAILRAQTDSSFKPNNWRYAMINAIDMINLTPTKRDNSRKAPYTKVRDGTRDRSPQNASLE